jgi:hypothetical protein
MYLPQLFETISEPIHAERIAKAERQRFACVPVLWKFDHLAGLDG